MGEYFKFVITIIENIQTINPVQITSDCGCFLGGDSIAIMPIYRLVWQL